MQGIKMNNICGVCKTTIDLQWTDLQNNIRGKGISNRHAKAFIDRCIYCYKQYLELAEKGEHDWYLQFMNATEKRFRW